MSNNEGYGIPGLFETPSVDMRSRLKIVLYGEAGSGKTILSIRMPAPLVMDCEYGWDVYKELYPQIPFAECNTFAKAETLLDKLYNMGNKVKAQTLTIDPITTLYSNLRATHLTEEAMEGKAFGTAGFAAVDRDWGRFLSKIARLSRRMNVVMIAREKGVFEERGATTFDAGRGLDYYADIVMQLIRTQDGRRVARTIKERMTPPRLPTEGTYDPWEQLQESYRTALYGGITTPQMRELVDGLKFNEEDAGLKERLNNAFGVDKLQLLTSHQALQLIVALRKEQKDREAEAKKG